MDNTIKLRKIAKNPKPQAPEYTNGMLRKFWDEARSKQGTLQDVFMNGKFSAFILENHENYKNLCAKILETQERHCEMEDDANGDGRNMKLIEGADGKPVFAWREGCSLDTLEVDYNELMSQPASINL